MALKDLSCDELTSVVEQLFADAGLSDWNNIRDISIAQIQHAINADYRLIKQVSDSTRAYIGETIAEALAAHLGPDDIAQQLIEDGKIKSLKTTDGRIIDIETRAQTIARTELFKNIEDTKTQTAQELMDDPIGIAHAVLDSTTRDNHREWNNWAMPLDVWMAAEDRPGKMPNCRCTLEITERWKYKGEIHESLPF